jgi:hypothetical protein
MMNPSSIMTSDKIIEEHYFENTFTLATKAYVYTILTVRNYFISVYRGVQPY